MDALKRPDVGGVEGLSRPAEFSGTWPHCAWQRTRTRRDYRQVTPQRTGTDRNGPSRTLSRMERRLGYVIAVGVHSDPGPPSLASQDVALPQLACFDISQRAAQDRVAVHADERRLRSTDRCGHVDLDAVTAGACHCRCQTITCTFWWLQTCLWGLIEDFGEGLKRGVAGSADMIKTAFGLTGIGNLAGTAGGALETHRI
jgi:hypothetical protein